MPFCQKYQLDNFDKISARGYSFGYVGSVILLIIVYYSRF